MATKLSMNPQAPPFASHQDRHTDYFARFPLFKEDLTAPLLSEFARLANYQGFGGKKSKTYRKEQKKCLAAAYDKYVKLIVRGSNPEKLEILQRLCAELRIESVPLGSIKACNTALRRVYINVVDLIDSRRGGKPVKAFPSHRALQEYTQKSGRFFPKDKIKEDGLLRALLRLLV